MDFAVLLLMVLPRNEGVLTAAVSLEVPVDEGVGGIVRAPFPAC